MSYPQLDLQLTIKKTGNSEFEVDDPKVPGSPPVGRGNTMMEAIGSWFHNNQHNIGLSFHIDESAVATEYNRVRRELAKR